MNPSTIIAQVAGSGTAEALKSPLISELNAASVLVDPDTTVLAPGLTDVKLKLTPRSVPLTRLAGRTLEVYITVSPDTPVEAVSASEEPPPKTVSVNVPLR